MRATAWVVPVLLAVPFVAGCASSAGASAARSTVEAYVAAWNHGDGARVCDLLAPETRSEVEQSAKKPCAAAILDEDLPHPKAVRDVQAWGRQGVVRLDADTVFVARLHSGWKVMAAGCRARADRPYDCQVQGG